MPFPEKVKSYKWKYQCIIWKRGKFHTPKEIFLWRCWALLTCSDSGRLSFPAGSLCQLWRDVLDAVQGCVGWVSCGDSPPEALPAAAPLILAGISLTQSWMLKGCWPPLLPQEMGSQEFHWRLFPIDFTSACCAMDHINLAGWRQQSRQDRLGWLPLWCHPFPAAGCNPGGKCLWQMTQTIGNFQKHNVLCWGLQGNLPPPGATGWGFSQIREKLTLWRWDGAVAWN